MKMKQFEPEITKIRAHPFEMSGKITDSANVASETTISCKGRTSECRMRRHCVLGLSLRSKDKQSHAE